MLSFSPDITRIAVFCKYYNFVDHVTSDCSPHCPTNSKTSRTYFKRITFLVCTFKLAPNCDHAKRYNAHADRHSVMHINRNDYTSIKYLRIPKINIVLVVTLFRYDLIKPKSTVKYKEVCIQLVVYGLLLLTSLT